MLRRSPTSPKPPESDRRRRPSSGTLSYCATRSPGDRSSGRKPLKKDTLEEPEPPAVELAGARFSNPKLVTDRGQGTASKVVLDQNETFPVGQVPKCVDYLGMIRLQLDGVGRSLVRAIGEHLVELPADWTASSLEINGHDGLDHSACPLLGTAWQPFHAANAVGNRPPDAPRPIGFKTDVVFGTKAL